MKIGILTFHRANNYGAVLQCYALQETLKNLGYEVQVIDYREPYTELIYNPIRWDIIKKGLTHPRLLAGYIFKIFPERYKRSKLYNAFRRKYLNCTQPIFKGQNMPQNFDVYLIGSDQMWSLHPTGNKIEPIYFGEFKVLPSSNIQGYGISSTIGSLETIGASKLSEYVNNFKRLSFRESIICNKVEELTGFRGEVVLDPVLLINFKEWDRLTTINPMRKKYLLTYFLNNELVDSKLKKNVEELARRQGLELVNMFDIAFSPIEFLNVLKYAECILTTSFHAVVFSIIFKKTFYAIRTNDGRDVRYINLMKELGIYRLIDTSDIPLLDVSQVNYKMVNDKLTELRRSSFKFLKNL